MQCMSGRQWAEAERIAKEQAHRLINNGYKEDGDHCYGQAGC